MNTHPTRIGMGLACLAVVGVMAVALPANAAPLIYEPFDYATGTVNGSQGGATGTVGTWSQSGGSGLYQVVASGLSFPGLATTGNMVRRPSAPGGSEINIGIDPGPGSLLTPATGTIYFSILVRNDRFSVGNTGFTFVLSSAPFDVIGPDKVNPTITGGEGLGIHLDAFTPNDGTIDIFGYTIDGGVATQSTGKVDNDATVNTFMIVGQIDWRTGSDDTLSLYNIADVNAALPAPFAVMTADIDQASIDTLAITDRQVVTADEIRVGLSLNDVGVVPEPASLALLGLGGLLIVRRK